MLGLVDEARKAFTNYHKNKMGLGSAMCDFCRELPETILHVMSAYHSPVPLWFTIMLEVSSFLIICNN